MLAVLILTLKWFRQVPRHCKQNKSTAVLVKKTWRDAAGIATGWKIKMASTFSFVIMKSLKLREKWSSTPEGSIFDIFKVSTIFYDELVWVTAPKKSKKSKNAKCGKVHCLEIHTVDKIWWWGRVWNNSNPIKSNSTWMQIPKPDPKPDIQTFMYSETWKI